MPMTWKRRFESSPRNQILKGVLKLHIKINEKEFDIPEGYTLEINGENIIISPAQKTSPPVTPIWPTYPIYPIYPDYPTYKITYGNNPLWISETTTSITSGQYDVIKVQ